MSDKRKPVFKFLLQKSGKKANKIEVFEAAEFEKNRFRSEKVYGKRLISSYRIRVNGRWWPKGEKRYFWKSEIRDLIFKSISF